MRSVVSLRLLATAILSLIPLAAACGDDSGGSPSPDPDGSPSPDAPPAVEGCDGDDGNPLPVAPQEQRVDLYTPTFSDPINVTNPLFPISDLHSALLLGKADGDPLRIETTLLPITLEITLNDGTTVEVKESQFVAFRNGRIEEVARDWYGQDDEGAVWYFGEDVFNYEDGEVADMEGTWLAGRDEAPAAMIMPASPQVDAVYRPENLCGVVFEEVTVTTVGLTVDGPTGPVEGAIVAQELHSDGIYEDKIFAPGYGEFSSGADDNIESLALAVPTDALSGPPSAELDALVAGSVDLFDAAEAADWSAAGASLAAMTAAWDAFLAAGGVPTLLQDQMVAELAELDAAVAAESAGEARHQAIATARAIFDLRLRHQPPTEIDRVRFDLWLAQVLVDVAADDAAGIKGDITSLEWVWDRIADTFDAADATAIEDQLAALRVAADAEDATESASVAAAMRAGLGGTGWQ